jgi:hypothetical protein
MQNNLPPAVFYKELRLLIIDFDKQHRNTPKTRGEYVHEFLAFAARRLSNGK